MMRAIALLTFAPLLLLLLPGCTEDDCTVTLTCQRTTTTTGGNGGTGATPSTGGQGGEGAQGVGGAGAGGQGGDGGSVPVVSPSCEGYIDACGPSHAEDCCTRTEIPGGTFNRLNNGSFPATVGQFYLDRFELTVGRFRRFVETYPASKPMVGDGSHPSIADSGWVDGWNQFLPETAQDLEAALYCPAFNHVPDEPHWTPTPGGREYKPQNCLSWYLALAFCAWDGGRLPTQAEWNYAAAGGSQQRIFPWSEPPQSTTINSVLAMYSCDTGGSVCDPDGFNDVGSYSPAGDARWGQADIAGGLAEWNLDFSAPTLPTPCVNCAQLSPLNANTAVRGGMYANGEDQLRTTDFSQDFPRTNSFAYIGVRCAYDSPAR